MIIIFCWRVALGRAGHGLALRVTENSCRAVHVRMAGAAKVGHTQSVGSAGLEDVL
jgi:hypothetical protein